MNSFQKAVLQSKNSTTRNKLREGFQQQVENYLNQEPVQLKKVNQLRRCPDSMPKMLCEKLGMTPGSSYAEAAQVLADRLKNLTV
jgi:hypothetical protein